MLLYTMLYIVLAYLILFAALTNSVCLNNASFFFLFKYFLCQGYELSGDIALKDNHYYYYYYTVLQWFSSYLTDRTHYVSLCNHCSDFAPVHSGVPQGSVLGPILFTMYIKPLSAIIDPHSIIHHSFADDLQLQMSAPPDRISELLHSMQSCMSDVKAWATANMLKLNDNKTELMLVTSKRTKHLHSLPTSITLGNAQIPFKKSVKNLGFTLDCHLTMNAHISNIARTCYFELCRLASIRRFLTSTATATLVSAFVLSRI